MEAITRRLIVDSGGRYHDYCQGHYIKGNQWAHTENAQRQGAWIGDRYDRKAKVMTYGLGKGVCLGLTGAYLVAGSIWDRFEDYLDGQDGRALVRGIMNFQEQLAANGNSKPMNMVFHQILRSRRVNFIKKNKVLRANISHRAGDEILKHVVPGYGYYIHIHAKWGAHAIGLRIDSGDIKLFDPNYGEAIYTYQQGRNQGMARFIGHLLSEFYAPFSSLYIERYTLR